VTCLQGVFILWVHGGYFAIVYVYKDIHCSLYLLTKVKLALIFVAWFFFVFCSYLEYMNDQDCKTKRGININRIGKI